MRMGGNPVLPHEKRVCSGARRAGGSGRTEPLGQVGLSGETQFAHLHISVRKDGDLVDPFARDYARDRCRYDSGNSVWVDGFAQAFAYQPTRVFQAGVADGRVALDDVMDGKWADFRASRHKPLVVYGLAVNGVTGDQLNLILTGPNGEIVRSLRDPLPKRKSQWFAFGGKAAPAGGWPAGRYETKVQVVRDGTILHQKNGSFTLD